MTDSAFGCSERDADRIDESISAAATVPPLMFAGIISSHGTALAVATLASWALFWGAMSAAVLARWRSPSQWWLAIGLLGPFGPLIALLVGLGGNRIEARRGA